MAEITVTIDGIKCAAEEGETILNIARANGIFIPALCYVSCCSPTLACRLCMADVDGKRVYTCNAKAKDGQVVVTANDEIEKERQAIMEVYTVNHPLECGVCDQSGECELQNYALALRVKEQRFAIPNTYKPIENWGVVRYDPSLCIVCERCVTVCKDKIGNAALKTVPRGEELAVPKEYKETMPKDAFAVWNKMQKSVIGKVTNEEGEYESCSDCGECAAVCPVGALVGTDFHYKANAWELTKIPASNPHSSDCSLIYYEVKQESIQNPNPKIYRVQGETAFTSLGAAARYGYDFENRVAKKDKGSFKQIIDFIKNEADTIAFNSFITNEEALILQKIKEKYDIRLVNEDAFVYQRFLKAFQKSAGNSLYKGSLDSLSKSDFIVSIGSMIRYDSPNSGYALNSALKMNKASALYCHPIHDKIVQNYSKNLISLNYKVGSEEAMFFLLLELFAPLDELDSLTTEYLRSFHTTTKKSVVQGEETKEIEEKSTKLWELAELEDISSKVQELKVSKDRLTLIIGEDILTHPRWENLAFIAGMLERLAGFEVLIIPSQTNTLGVSLICELDEKEEGKVLGYNRAGDVTISALGGRELDMPALNQQEGTFTNINKRVVPTNAALPYNGYELNDIANALGIEAKLTIDYTKQLPQNSGFKEVNFDDLPNHYDNAGNEHRGYLLKTKGVKITKFPNSPKIDAVAPSTLYRLNPPSQFSPFTNKAHQLKTVGALYVSSEFLEEYGLKDKQRVKITSQTGAILDLRAELDKNIKGNFAYLPTFDERINISPFFETYRYAKCSLKGVEDE